MSAARRPQPQKKNAPADVAASRGHVSGGKPSTAHKVRHDAAPVNVVVGEIVTRGDGAQVIAARAAEMDWTLARLSDGDAPRIRDIDLAERLGFERPRKIREIIERHASLGNITPNGRPTVERSFSGRGRKALHEIAVTEYWLTLEDALFVATQSETKRAVFVTKVMIAVFAAVMLGRPPTSALPQNVVALLEDLRSELAESRREYTDLVRLVHRSGQHRAEALSKRINAAASLTANATKRPFKSCRMEIESVVRDRSGYPRSPRNTFESMPAHTWEQAMLFAEQELYRAERLSNAISQITLKAVGT